MRELKLIDIENSTIVVVHPDGEEFRISIDETTLHRLRNSRSAPEKARVSPKDVQAHIRAGMSAAEVSQLTGASLDFIARFEGPVLAERDFIINSALAVETQATVDLETGETSSAFGALIHSRLRDISATGERWASWKEPDGSWVIKLEFDSAEISHDARWAFEPRKHALTPLNSDAAALSQKGEMTTGIIPRLRAVAEEMAVVELSQDDSLLVAGPQLATVSHIDFSVTSEEFTYETNVFVGMADIFDAEDGDNPNVRSGDTGTSPTADLLEALRRRRGERESTPAWLRDELATGDPAATGRQVDNDSDEPTESTAPPALFPEAELRPGTQRTGSHARRERTSMPSWDEIVFGTRSDEETP